MSYNYVMVDIQDKVAVLTINRPKALNALNGDVLSEISDAFDGFAKNDGVKAVVITGAGDKSFVAGADIGFMATIGALDAMRYIRLGHQTMDKIAALNKPVIAAVNGFALGGGLELALACDFIIAAENAKFGLPEVTLGIIPGWGGTQRLTAQIGPGKAKEMIYTGKVIDAAEAEKIGLVNAVLPAEGFLAAVLSRAGQITKNSAVALGMAKISVNSYLEGGGQVGRNVEMQSVSMCFASEDQKEGMAAFLEKRKPVFKDK